MGLLQAKFGTCSSRLNFLGLSLGFTKGRPGATLPRNLACQRRGSGERADERGARGFALFPQSPPRTAAAPQPASPPVSGVAALWNGCGWRIQMLPSCVPVAGLEGAASVRRRPLPAVGFVRPPLRPAPSLPAPSAVPLPRRGRRERAGQPGVKPTRLRRGGIRRRAELGAEAASAEKKKKKKCPPEETHKFYRGDSQPARGTTGGQAREPPEPRGLERSRGPQATQPPAARGEGDA